MQFAGVDIPEKLVEAAKNGNLVVFAGAGVSKQKPLELPLFDELVSAIKEKVDLADCLRPRGDGEAAEKYLDYLEEQHCDIRSACCEVLEVHGESTSLHWELSRLFKDVASVKIVTTNFDKCFENVFDPEDAPKVFCAPALPLGKSFTGVVYLHGSVDDPGTMVLTAKDYGSAYVSDGWASRFLVSLFKSYTALFIGYSCNDALVDYLTRSISSDIDGNAFALLWENESADEWSARGVEVIRYKSHDDLPAIMKDVADNFALGVADRAKRVEAICRTNESLKGSNEEFVRQALTWNDPKDRVVFTRAFCNGSDSIMHLKNLESWGLTGFLTKQNLDDSEYQLLRWAIRCFSVGETEEFQTFCSKKYSLLSSRFFDQLVWHLASSDARADNVGPWVAWIEAASHVNLSQIGDFLSDIALRVNHAEITLAIARLLLRVGLSFKETLVGGCPAPTAVVAVDASYDGERLLKAVRANADEIGGRLFDYCLRQIEIAYSIQSSCWTMDSFDSISYMRSSVAEHEQDCYSSGAGSILLTMARECKDYIDIKAKAKECLDSKCSLIVRLGLWLAEESDALDQSLALLRENDYLFEVDLRHEAFSLLKAGYGLADENEKNAFEKYLRSKRTVDEDSLYDYQCFNICSWVLRSYEDDERLAKLRDDILADNPSFKEREHPDFSHYMTSGGVDIEAECHLDPENLTKENLLTIMEAPPQPDKFATSSDYVSVAASDYPERALSILEALLDCERTPLESQLTNYLIRFLPWTKVFDSVAERGNMLSECLRHKDLFESVLQALCSVTFWGERKVEWTFPVYAKLVDGVLEGLLLVLEGEQDMSGFGSSTWASISLNHPIGGAISFVAGLGSVSKTDVEARICREKYELLINALIPLIRKETDVAKCAIAGLFAHIGIMFEMMPEKATQQILPLLDSVSWTALPAWEGMACSRDKSFACWRATEPYWPGLFLGRVDLGKDCLNALAKSYVSLAMALHSGEESRRMICQCASASLESCRASLFQLGSWLKQAEDAQKLKIWDEWLGESISFLQSQYAGDGSSLADTVVEFYARWLRDHPVLRAGLIETMADGALSVESGNVFVSKETWGEIASEENLTEPQKAKCIASLVHCEKHFHYKKSAKNAVKAIDLEKLSPNDVTVLKDEFARQGMYDIW